MHRFWIGLLSATLAFLLIWSAFFNFFPRKIFGFDYAMWEAKYDLVARDREPIDVVILGDSGSVSALKATGTKRSTLNLALPCSGPAEQFYLFDHYLKVRPAPRVLVVSTAPPLFYDTACIRDVFLPYGFASLAERAEVVNRYAEIGQSLELFGRDEATFDALKIPLRVRNALYLALTALHLSPQQLAGAANLFDVPNWKGYDSDHRQAVEARGHYVYGLDDSYETVITQDHNMRYSDFRPNPVTVTYLEKIFSLARAHGTKVLFRPVPFNAATTAAMKEPFWSEYRTFFRDFSARHPDVRFVTDWRVLPPDCFGDSWCHTNMRGAEVESAHLEAQLAEFDR